MKSILKRVICLALVMAFSLSPMVALYDGASDWFETDSLFKDVTGDVDLTTMSIANLASSVMVNSSTSSTRTLIVSLEGKNLVEEADGRKVSDYAASPEGIRKNNKLKAAQDKFLDKLETLGISYNLKNRYTAVSNAVAIEVDTAYMSVIKAISGVESVCLSETYLEPETVDMGSYASTSEEDMDDALAKASAVVNKTSVYKTGVYDSSSVTALGTGYQGDGSVVAIIDTGLDYTHNAFIWDAEHESEYSLSNAAFNKSDIAEILNKKNLKAEELSLTDDGGNKTISVNDVYISQKVPFAYDYADKDTDVYPSYSNHGTHVAGIVAGYDPDGYTDKDGNHVEEAFVGVAPAAQLVICKVFTDDLDDPEVGGAETEDILAALEDCVLLGVDVINMSLGTSCGFSTTDDGDEEGEMLNEVYSMVGEAGISLVAAASNDYSASYGGTFGTNLASNPDSGTVGSPSVFAAALSVASISGKTSPFFIANDSLPVYYEESSDKYNKYYSFSEMMLGDKDSATFEYVVVPGVGRSSDYSSVKDKLEGRVALVKRGSTTFQEKVELAMDFGAIGIIVYNNVAGMIRMSLGEVEDPIPSSAISMDAGKAMVAAADSRGIGVVTINTSYQAGPFMSDFSSWGATPDLKLKPEVTAHGGEITSAVPGGYGEQSGTSMASPNMAGVITIVRSYLKSKYHDMSTVELNRRVNQLVMSTATIVYDKDNLPYSPRKQGAGLGSLANAVSTGAYLYTEDTSIDCRPKVNLGDDKDKSGVYEVTFKISNFGSSELSFKFNPILMTETLASDGLAVAEQAYLLDDNTPTWNVVGYGTTVTDDVLTISAGSEADISVTFTLSNEEKNYIEKSFVNGMYLEGFVSLVSRTEGQCDLTLPFLGFYGDWTAAPMLDYSAYEIAAAEQDTSIKDEEKPQASIWATQPYTTYYNDTYSMPMGSFAYLQDPNADQIYTSEEHNAVSCYDEFFGENDGNNYLTTYQFRGLYVGMLRGARKVTYNLVNVDTGEELYSNVAYRINKAYTQGGSGGVPSYIKFEIEPLEYGFVSNGKYQMNFEFFMDYGDEDRTEPDGTYSFTFYADYEAPSLQDVRVRFQDYKDGNKTKQRIYLDLDVFDNHYAMACLLCYYDGEYLQQINDYVAPVYDAVKNGTTTVSIEITDIYDDYKNLYLQIDDYALNHSVYAINLAQANAGVTPDEFELASGEENITLDIYETHNVKLSYSGDGNLSNFSWSSDKYGVANVKNGEIVGIGAGTAKITVSNGKGVIRTINVTVTDNEKKLSIPSLSFSTIADYDDNLVNPSDGISLYPDQDVTLTIVTDPWYYPKDTLEIKWRSTKPEIVEVDQSGNLTLHKKGTASVQAMIVRDGNETAYGASVEITVLDPFVISGYSLTKYRGTDTLVEIPDDKMVLYIGEDAFKDNTTMEEVIIPKTTININKQAFLNCTALRSVYIISKEAQDIADADLTLIYRSAFQGCTSLELIDLTNAKVVTLGVAALKGCSSLKEIKKMSAIGTAFDNAFEGCTSLVNVDLTGMHVAGDNVFYGCTSLANVTTGQFTDIGDYMFYGCTALKKIVLNNASIGTHAFEGCTKLSEVRINYTEDSFVIGDEAFASSGLRTITFGQGTKVRKIGNKAFSNTKLNYVTLPEGLTEIGEDIFLGANYLNSITLPADFDYEKITLAGGLFSGVEISLADESAYSVEGNLIYNKDKTILYGVLNDVESVTLPEGLIEIYDYALANTRVKSISIPSTVTKLGNGAFKNSSLITIEFLGTGINGIGDETFYGTKISSITLPSSVTSIGAYAFSGSLLSAIDLTGVTSIGEYAFSECSHLSSVSDIVATSIGDYAFLGCTALSNAVITSVNEMGEGVFIRSGLESITFGNGATTLGEFTFFSLDTLTDVVIGSGITEIEEGTFNGCSSLLSVNLGAVTVIGEYAFYGCYSLETIDLSAVEEIGDMAFGNCVALTSIDLSSATIIGAGAFGMDGVSHGVESVVLGNALTEIGISAFEGTALTSVNIPSGVVTIGFAAFAYAEDLSEITVDASNGYFFTEEGVLYKKISNGYELVAYPLALESSSDTYTVKDDTVRIEAYAFAGLEDKETFKKVVFPYTVSTIGDGAFYESGITEYTFNSINAPVLETVGKDIVEDIMNEHFENYYNPVINAYYYSNFNTLFVNYIEMVGEKSSMIINRPTNGVGYDNYVYSRYFGTVNYTGIVMDDTTRAFLNTMDNFVSDDVLRAWEEKVAQGDFTSYKDDVKAFSAIVKEARRLYGNIKDDAQKDYIDDDVVSRLETVENRMRSIKKSYGIAVEISNLKVDLSSYKSTYKAGEKFDMTGLIITIVYDDGSTEIADSASLTLVTTEELQTYYNDVEVIYTYIGADGEPTTETAFVPIKVTATGVDVDTDNSGTDNEGPSAGMIVLYVAIGVVGAALIAGGIILAIVLVKRNKKKTISSSEEQDEHNGEGEQE